MSKSAKNNDAATELLDAMKATLSSSTGATREKEDGGEGTCISRSLEGFEENRDALVSHFGETTRKCLLELSERRRDEILEYYYRELTRFVSTSTTATQPGKSVLSSSSQSKSEQHRLLTREESVGSVPPLSVRSGEGSSPSPSITRAIASRIHYFHSMEATISKLAKIESESATRSFYFAVAAIVGFFILLVGGGAYVFGTENELRTFLTDTFSGQRRGERRTLRQLFSRNLSTRDAGGDVPSSEDRQSFTQTQTEEGNQREEEKSGDNTEL